MNDADFPDPTFMRRQAGLLTQVRRLAAPSPWPEWYSRWLPFTAPGTSGTCTRFPFQPKSGLCLVYRCLMQPVAYMLCGYQTI